MQALNFWGVLEELDLGKRVPDLQGLGYSMLGVNDSLTFTSNTWNITLDPHSGAAGSPTPPRGPPALQVVAAEIQHMAPVALFKLRLCCIADRGRCMCRQARQHPATSAAKGRVLHKNTLPTDSIHRLLRMIPD